MLPRWDTHEEARFAVEAASLEKFPDSMARLGFIAKTWADNVGFRWQSLYFLNPKDVARAATGGILNIGFFASSDGFNITYAVVAVTFDGGVIRSQVESLQGCVGEFCAFGSVAIFNEFILGDNPKASDRAKKEAAEWSPSPSLKARIDERTLRAIRLVDLTAAYDPSEVGGVVDALELWADGTTHWVYRKDNCPERED